MGSGGSSQRRGLKFITLLKSRGGKGFSRGGEYPPSPPPLLCTQRTKAWYATLCASLDRIFLARTVYYYCTTGSQFITSVGLAQARPNHAYTVQVIKKCPELLST